jgi:chromosome partitioning protein
VKTITFANEKGGVSKTTLAITLAAGLAIEGQRVVLLDTDAQANATTTLGIDEQPCAYDLLVREAAFVDVLRRVSPEVYCYPDRKPAGELLLIPSNVETRNIGSSLADDAVVKERLDELQGWADTVIIDTAPTPSLFHLAIYRATDYVIYPCTCESLAIAGLEKSLSRIRSSSNYRQANSQEPIRAMGIVPTMYRSQTALHPYNLGQLKEQHGDLVWSEIPQRITWSEAAQLSQTVFAYAPNSEAAKDGWKVVERVKQNANVR